MPRKFYDIAIDGLGGNVSMDVPDGEVDSSTLEILIKPLCVLCIHCPQDSRAAFFSKALADCTVNARDLFVENTDIKRWEVTRESTDRSIFPEKTGEWFKHIKAHCERFSLKK
jgi:hypothetical protein